MTFIRDIYITQNDVESTYPHHLSLHLVLTYTSVAFNNLYKYNYNYLLRTLSMHYQYVIYGENVEASSPYRREQIERILLVMGFPHGKVTHTCMYMYL